MKIIIYSLLLFLLWIPRILCILFAAFITLFAMDVFGHNSGFWRTLLALLAHLVPTFLVVIILILSWRWAWIGGISYFISGIAYIIWWGGESQLIYIPLVLVGVLFLLSWFFRKEIKMAQAIYWDEETG